jgi:hypothetical protein
MIAVFRSVLYLLYVAWQERGMVSEGKKGAKVKCFACLLAEREEGSLPLLHAVIVVKKHSVPQRFLAGIDWLHLLSLCPLHRELTFP